MSQVKQMTSKALGDLKSSLTQLPLDMRLFSLSMRSLYTDTAVGTSSDTAQKFRKLRDDTKNDAAVYLQCILPESTKFVSCLKEYFEYYDTLSFDEWLESLQDILEESKTYKAQAQAVLKMHEMIIEPLKKRQDEAKIIMTEFRDLQKEFEKKKNELEAKARDQRGWACALAAVPYVGLIVCPLLRAFGDANLAEAIATQQQSDIEEAAALIVAEAIIPALCNIVDGLVKAAGFFEIVEEELRSFMEKPETEIESPKQLYYNRLNAEAKEIKLLCQRFFTILPEIRTDFKVIPSEGTDQNYVDKWLSEKKWR